MKDNKLLKTFQFIVIIILPFITDYYLPIIEIIKEPYTYFGLLVIIAGIYLTVKTSLLFRRADNSFTLNGKSAELITEDVFAISRNPMYLGMLLVFTGLAIYLGSLSVFIYPSLFFIFSNKIIGFEEEKLVKMYGDDYKDYKRKTRRWI